MLWLSATRTLLFTKSLQALYKQNQPEPVLFWIRSRTSRILLCNSYRNIQSAAAATINITSFQQRFPVGRRSQRSKVRVWDGRAGEQRCWNKILGTRKTLKLVLNRKKSDWLCSLVPNGEMLLFWRGGSGRRSLRVRGGNDPIRREISDVERLLNGEDDVFDLRQAVLLQDLSVRHGDVHARYPGNRGVQEVEGRTWRRQQGGKGQRGRQVPTGLVPGR